jgi:hypothetical protein
MLAKSGAAIILLAAKNLAFWEYGQRRETKRRSRPYRSKQGRQLKAQADQQGQ